MYRLYLSILNLYWYLVAAWVALPPTNAHKRTFFKSLRKDRGNLIRVNPKLLVC